MEDLNLGDILDSILNQPKPDKIKAAFNIVRNRAMIPEVKRIKDQSQCGLAEALKMARKIQVEDMIAFAQDPEDFRDVLRAIVRIL